MQTVPKTSHVTVEILKAAYKDCQDIRQKSGESLIDYLIRKSRFFVRSVETAYIKQCKETIEKSRLALVRLEAVTFFERKKKEKSVEHNN